MSRGLGRGSYKVSYEKLRDPYQLNDLKDHNQIWDHGQVRYNVKIWVSYCGGLWGFAQVGSASGLVEIISFGRATRDLLLENKVK